MHLDSDSPFQNLITKLGQPEHLDLDELRRNLLILSARWEELYDRATLYESEFQRELRAKIDLCGGIPGCPDKDFADLLSGEELLAARRTASLQFNRVFYMAPLTRNAIAKNHVRENSRNLLNDVRLRAQKNL
ncbi:hypothetical protein EH220_07710 [bacterium]|nr:MAG: hypothetical protein EH220_07710 [bacterium]